MYPAQDDDLRNLSERTEEILARLEGMSDQLSSQLTQNQQAVQHNGGLPVKQDKQAVIYPSYSNTPDNNPKDWGFNFPQVAPNFVAKKTAVYTEHHFSTSPNSHSRQVKHTTEETQAAHSSPPVFSNQQQSYQPIISPPDDYVQPVQPQSQFIPQQPEQIPVNYYPDSENQSVYTKNFKNTDIENQQTRRINRDSSFNNSVPSSLSSSKLPVTGNYRDPFEEENYSNRKNFESRARNLSSSQSINGFLDPLRFTAYLVPFFAFVLSFVLLEGAVPEGGRIAICCSIGGISILLSLMALRVIETHQTVKWLQRKVQYLQTKLD